MQRRAFVSSQGGGPGAWLVARGQKLEPWVGRRAGSGAAVPGLAALTLRRWLSTLARPALGLGALAMG